MARKDNKKALIFYSLGNSIILIAPSYEFYKKKADSSLIS
jgi:hypothetical protein